jgi:hypothetical protein
MTFRTRLKTPQTIALSLFTQKDCKKNLITFEEGGRERERYEYCKMISSNALLEKQEHKDLTRVQYS